MMTQLLATVVLLAAALGAVCAQGQTAIAGIDHIPLVVRDLERAASDFERLGFAIKRGRQHANGAVAMSEIWIALDDAAALRQLLLAPGASAHSAVVQMPESADGEIFELQNGRALLVPGRYQRVPGRPIRGVVMSMRPVPSGATAGAGAPRHAGHATAGTLLQPSQAHGLWLAFR